MKGKKLLSMLTAGALVVSMVMPVMAADDGGSFEVDVSTKTGVLRVQVPTTMAIAVDQFEIEHTGTQIAAGEFEMTNKSEMDVKVTITSTATLGEGVKLVSTAKAAEDSTGADAWLGVAAMTNDGSTNSGKKYDDLKTGTDEAPKAEEFWELTDANANVTSFAADTKKAEQTFYLTKGSGSKEYNLAVPSAATQAPNKTFAKFYELTVITVADSNELQAAVDAGDVYKVTTANIGNDGESVTKIEKGTESVTKDSDATYYTASDVASTPGDNTDTKVYVYAAMGTDGGKAGFIYIGKLGGKETWTAADIKKISVAYKIAGVTGTRYNEVVDDCTYGLYVPTAVEVAGAKITNPNGSTVLNATTLPERLKASPSTVIFQVGEDDAAKLSGKTATKIVINDAEYTFTAADSTFDAVKGLTDGKVYTIAGFKGNSVSAVQVYYDESLVINYSFD